MAGSCLLVRSLVGLHFHTRARLVICLDFACSYPCVLDNMCFLKSQVPHPSTPFHALPLSNPSHTWHRLHINNALGPQVQERFFPRFKAINIAGKMQIDITRRHWNKFQLLQLGFFSEVCSTSAKSMMKVQRFTGMWQVAPMWRPRKPPGAVQRFRLPKPRTHAGAWRSWMPRKENSTEVSGVRGPHGKRRDPMDSFQILLESDHVEGCVACVALAC